MMGPVPTSGLASILPTVAVAAGKGTGPSAGAGKHPEAVGAAKDTNFSSPLPEQAKLTPDRRVDPKGGIVLPEARGSKAVSRRGAKTLPPQAASRGELFRKLLGGKLLGVDVKAGAAEEEGLLQSWALPIVVRGLAIRADAGRDVAVGAEGEAVRRPARPLALAAAIAASDAGVAGAKAKRSSAGRPGGQVQAEAQGSAGAVKGPSPTKPKIIRVLSAGRGAGQDATNAKNAAPDRAVAAEPANSRASAGQLPVGEGAAATGRRLEVRAAIRPGARSADAARPAGKGAEQVKVDASSGQGNGPGRALPQIEGQQGNVIVEAGSRAGGHSPAGRAGQPAPMDASDASGQPSVASQIADTVRANAARAGGQIVIRLHPPELGKVRLRLHAEGSEIRGVLEVDNPRTLGELQREAPALIQRLADDGVQLRRLDVQLNDQHGGEGFNSLLRDGQGGPGEGPAERSGQPADEPAPLDGPEADEPDPAGQVGSGVVDGSINVWR